MMSSVITINITTCQSPPHWTIFAAHWLIKDVGQNEFWINTKTKLFQTQRRLRKNLRWKTHNLSIATSQPKNELSAIWHVIMQSQLNFTSFWVLGKMFMSGQRSSIAFGKSKNVLVCKSHLLHTHPCLKKAMEESEKKGQEVEAGMFKSTFISHSHESIRLFWQAPPWHASSG